MDGLRDQFFFLQRHRLQDLISYVTSSAVKVVEEASVSNVKAFMNILKPHGATSASTKSAFEALITYLNVKEKRS